MTFSRVITLTTLKGNRVSSRATEGWISVRGFGTIVFRSEVVGRKEDEIFEIMHWAA